MNEGIFISMRSTLEAATKYNVDGALTAEGGAFHQRENTPHQSPYVRTSNKVRRPVYRRASKLYRQYRHFNDAALGKLADENRAAASLTFGISIRVHDHRDATSPSSCLATSMPMSIISCHGEHVQTNRNGE